MRSSTLLAAVVAIALPPLTLAEEWSFREYMLGDWDMERHGKDGRVDHAHYSLGAVGSNLEGTYHEDGEFGPQSEMEVRVVFEDSKAGEFQLAKKPVAKQAEQSDEPPTPQPDQPQVEYKTVFEFDFHAQSDSRFHVSESSWKGKAGGTVQFLAMDDAFVFSKVVCPAEKEGAMSSSTWSAVRKGAPRKVATTSEKKTMLQKYGWYIFAAMCYVAYKAAVGKAMEAVGGGKKQQ